MKRSFATLGLAAVGVLTAALCTSCSSSSKTGSSGSSSTGSSASSGHVVGGTKADSSKSPVLVGFQNLEGGTVFSLPAYRQGFEAGIDYVNTELGGVNGHPIKAVECKSAGTPDSAVACGNQFVQSKV
ncbi:MAG: ABC transporter substrate-binding protein, partial [Actinomycetota bacterium]|nr:ABC transporter substrate-binding protein [Actinomycetota bacterium]